MSTGKEFMENTKYKYLKETDQVMGLPQPELADALRADRVVIDLPAPASLKPQKVDLTEAMVSRVSVRQYSDEPLTLDELSYLLWVTQGVKQVTSRPATLRTVPSAGSRHPFETYLLINRVVGLEPGIYHYAALDHKLERVSVEPGLVDRVTLALFRQGMVRESAVTFLWVAVAYRTKWRYTERGYRYMHLDAGHVCQNLYLGVQAVGCGCCGIAAFNDELVAEVLDIDGVERFGIYMAVVGKLKS
jgi:SagB-type dehydrogenase family enzyme